MEIECIGDINLRDVNAQYRLLFECALDIIFISDLNGNILDVNHAGIRSYGYTRDQLLSMNVRDLRIPSERGLATKQLNEAYTKGNTYETVHQRKDGSTFHVEISARGIIVDKEKLLINIVRDITKRKENEKYLARIAAIVESSDDAIIGMTVDGVITEWNHGAVGLYGYTAKEMLGQSVSILIPKDRAGELSHILETIKNGGRIIHFDTVRLRKDMTSVLVSLTASPIKGRSGEVLGISWTARDITERKKVEEELEEAKENVELYLDLMSHDINNYNQTAMGYLELAFEAKTLNEAKELMKKPFEALENSSKLIENVSKLKQVKTKSLKYHAIDLCDVFKGLVQEYTHISGKDVVINFKPYDGCFVVANNLVRDVFSNLISNSIKHSDDVRPLIINISIEPFEENGRKCYKAMVEDNGPGIPDELKGKIFRKFQRGKTRASGKGLGLFLVNTLVTDFGGKVWVEDRVQGDYTKGARFVVTLPVVEK
jgi:PAS domain S-box-containing protein